MSTTAHDWSRFVVRVNVNAPVEKLYHGCATREGIEILVSAVFRI